MCADVFGVFDGHCKGRARAYCAFNIDIIVSVRAIAFGIVHRYFMADSVPQIRTNGTAFMFVTHCPAPRLHNGAEMRVLAKCRVWSNKIA